MTSTIEHVAWSLPEADRSGTLLVVALHGRGADEHSMVGLSTHLPVGLTLAAPRAPIDLNGGYAWFANRGIGRPIEESIKAVGESLRTWLDAAATGHSGVALLGFSGGTAMAGGLVLAEPQRFAGAILLSGTLPWDAGYDTSDGRLAGLPVFWSIDADDAVIPRDLVERSEAWLRTSSGAALEEHRYPGVGHAISVEELEGVSEFVTGLPRSLQ